MRGGGIIILTPERVHSPGQCIEGLCNPHDYTLGEEEDYN